ncbi:RNA polymerase II C-terminal domain phosphatase-like 1 isoform X2 [Phalaenopsis equestris]|uniref:RNA polymerase II C-terminal domain phosphatase-like 1 isoform X2 n=1 Tax=Phalaenopsis equestris TaxID=78828 RepID=UPI0009E44A2F|nr:RNA polymerase II C-terminal domain phosphatase-like 1 isoform X2 [Phalaenopsis equestris]
MFRSVLYHGNSLIGEVEIQPKNSNLGTWTREIRISHFSPPSDRCPPLAVLQTIATSGVCFRMESKRSAEESLLFSVYSACLRENKTAVSSIGEEELHLVAMPSRRNIPQHSFFWGFIVARGLYNSCLIMLNLRCLGIVFDLDETLIVANTMRSFEDRIDALQRKIGSEVDPQRVNGMLAEIKRYQDDKSILKQYVDNDQVVESGKVFKTQSEAVPRLSDSHQMLTRPIIRLHEKNIILTRVNPAIRDTSVLVRLRPAWEDLRSYLTAKGRKRFEVYVCTMAERDYALEMWRLLDPESSLINSKELLDRIVCVKSGLKKSLFSVFQDGVCHPKMSLVIDDRLKVWDEKDQSRVHVVPPFAPYFAPQAEANNNIPVLCVARNVACNVRGSFFKDFDEVLLPRMSEVSYEDELECPSAPDVGNYLISEDDASTLNGNKNPLGFDGMADAEVERRLKGGSCNIVPAVAPIANNFDTRVVVPPGPPAIAPPSPAVSLAATPLIMPMASNQFPQTVASGKPLGQSVLSEHSLQGSSWEEGEVPESDLDPNTRRRLLILQHGQDTRDAPPPQHPSFPTALQVPVPPVQPRGNWFPVEEGLNSRKMNMVSRDFSSEHEMGPFDKNRSRYRSFYRTEAKSVPSERVFHESQRFPMQVSHGEVRPQPNKAASNFNSFQGNESMGHLASNYSDAHFNSNHIHEDTPVGFLREISRKCGTKIEFRSNLLDTTELQFSVEIWFVGDKVGEGIGRTRKEAQLRAAENSLQNLANTYLSNTFADTAHAKESGFSSDLNSSGYSDPIRNDFLTGRNTPISHLMGQEGSKRAAAPVAALKELCMIEGYNLVFQAPSLPAGCSTSKGEVYAQVEIAGQVLGKGFGVTWEDAKIQAAEEALESLKSKPAQVPLMGSGSSRILPASSNKRLKQDFPHSIPRILS